MNKMANVDLSEATIKRINDMLYEGVGLDEQINHLLDDLEELYISEFDIDIRKVVKRK